MIKNATFRIDGSFSDIVLFIEGCKFSINDCVNDIGSDGDKHKFEILMANSEP